MTIRVLLVDDQELVRDPELFARIHAAALASQPLAVEQVGPGELGPHPRVAEPLDRLTVETIRSVALAQ